MTSAEPQDGATPDVAVVGSANADITVQVARPPRRGETVTGGELSEGPGGKGLNQAVAAARLGLRVAMVGAVGNDAAGGLLRRVAERAGITGLWTVSERPTGRALVLVDDDGDSTITVAPGANAEVGRELVLRHTGTIAAARAVLLQQEVPEAGVRAAVAAARGLVVLNPAPARPVPPDVLGRVDVLVPNAAELAAQAGSDDAPTDPAAAASLVARLPGRRPDGSVVVTLGARGAVVVLPDGAPVEVPAVPVEVVDATAAGDTFCAALVDGLVRGGDVVEAARWAVRAAAVTVSRSGAAESVPHRHEIPG